MRRSEPSRTCNLQSLHGANTRQETTVFTVSGLNASIKSLLESSYPMVWVKGEVSNFRMASSGHSYFTLKDEQSQIRAVLFRTQQRHLRFNLESGLKVICQCRISVYEPRGEYQLIVEILEPLGRGALHLAFEQLKRKLEEEGLFDPSRKPPMPLCPQRIGIITSPTGAAIRDIIKTLQRATLPIRVTVFPVRVQGDGAGREIADAIALANLLQASYHWDVLIAGRGGGSIEDLWAFNEEAVARAISGSSIPVISAVGHEIDITISDLAATMRAPTPTAAAEWVVGRLVEVENTLKECRRSLSEAVLRNLEGLRRQLDFLTKSLADPRRRLQDLRLVVDERVDRMQSAMGRYLRGLQRERRHITERLLVAHPGKAILAKRSLLMQLSRELNLHYRGYLERVRSALQQCLSELENLNPLAVLSRGYSLTLRLPHRQILRDSRDVEQGAGVLVHLARGSIECTVMKVSDAWQEKEEGKL